MGNDLHEQDEFARGFEAGESAQELPGESLNEDQPDESDDSMPEAGDGGEGDPQSGDEDSGDDAGSASDQILPEEDEAGEDPDSADTDDADPRGSGQDLLAEGRALLDRYFGGPDQAGPDQSGQSGKDRSVLVEIPAEDKAEVETILRVNPQYEDILLEDSEQGQRYRANLHEFGPEVVMGMLESALQLRQVNPRVEAVISRHEQDRRRDHFAAIGNDHPDYVQMVVDPGRAEELGRFNASVRSWAEDLPYREASAAFRIMESGSAAEVSELLTRYKKAVSGNAKDKVDVDAARKITAVPGKRKSVSGRQKPDMDDFDGGFEAAAAEA
ncbi:hypothetical protein [Maridesulfovibrio sp. FT414]|uniref:hypothetical protein n=1 Tax=Maridesulfovibrio sp. FT414 TaxID=2979469 RepID=UPI003D8011D9